jgi:hypothetical protein
VSQSLCQARVRSGQMRPTWEGGTSARAAGPEWAPLPRPAERTQHGRRGTRDPSAALAQSVGSRRERTEGIHRFGVREERVGSAERERERVPGRCPEMACVNVAWVRGAGDWRPPAAQFELFSVWIGKPLPVGDFHLALGVGSFGLAPFPLRAHHY